MVSDENHPNSPPNVIETNKVVKDIVHIIEEGEKKLKHQYEVENAILLLGGSGAGKTTFAYTIAGYEEMLISKKKSLKYIITKPDSDVIGESYTTSKTVFPELLLNNQTKIAYYDFPGFEDTRGAIYDITTTYFIKKILNNAKRIKMIFLINYASFSTDGERNGFTKLIYHITKFVKNVDKFKDCIALVVTKVLEPGVPDDEIIKSIADFMKEAKEQLRTQITEVNINHSKEIQLINTFLLQKGKKCQRIGIFKQPNEEGSLKDIPLIQESKRSIEHIIGNLKFNEKMESDFGYFIPKQSLHEVGKMIDEINRSITDAIKKSCQEIQKNLSNTENKLYDINELYSKTNTEYEKLQALQETANKHETENCVKELVQGVVSSYGPSVHQNLVSLKQYGTFASFLHNISDHLKTDSFKCAAGLNDVIMYSSLSKKWYHFLKELFERLSEYEVQRNTLHGSPCIKFANELNEGIEKGKFSSTAFIPFLKECFPVYDYEHNGILEIKLDKPKLNALKRTIEYTLMYPMDISSCKSEKLTVKRHFVKITDILNTIANKCNGIPPKIIEIFALNKVFIDTNLILTNLQVQLSIIAPIWDIRGSPKIVLDGGSGEAHNSTNAPDGISFNENGKHGHPGLPGLAGNPGGSFLGIGEIFINPEQLTISANGGHGGRGQNGGDGGIGADGSDAVNDLYTPGCEDWCIDRHDGVKSRNQNIISNDFVDGLMYKESRVIIAGKSGSEGGNGGDGGRGGYGGYSGNIVIIPLSYPKSTVIRMEMNNGNLGSDGNGGRGAAGGKNGNNLKVIVPMTFVPLRNEETTVIPITTRAFIGKNGIKGRNTADMKLAEQSHSFLNQSIIITDYKNYAKGNLKRSVIESYQTKFFSKLENKNLVSTQGNKQHNKRENYKMYEKISPQNSNTNPQLISLGRARRHVTNYTENIQKVIQIEQENKQFQRSSANIAKSPLNNAINLISDILTPLELFYRFNVMNYNFIKGGIQSMFGVLEHFNIHTRKNFNTQVTSAVKFDVNASLTLADFFIRWSTGMKPNKYSEEKLMNSFEVRAFVLNIIENFEGMLNDLSMQYNLCAESLEFDPVILISKLEKEVINGNFEEIGQILFQSIADKLHFLDDIHFCNN